MSAERCRDGGSFCGRSSRCSAAVRVRVRPGTAERWSPLRLNDRRLVLSLGTLLVTKVAPARGFVLTPSRDGGCWPDTDDSVREACCRADAGDSCFGGEYVRAACCEHRQVVRFDPWSCWPGFADAHTIECCWGDASASNCFDEFRTWDLCCLSYLELNHSESEAACPWAQSSSWADRIQTYPSRDEPFVLLRDQKVGGMTLELWILASLLRMKKVDVSQVALPRIHGVPFFLKSHMARRHMFEIVAGAYDWRIMHDGLACSERKKVHGLVLLRNPVDRFLSFYYERSSRRHERRFNRSIAEWTVPELREYLRSVTSRNFVGDEPGLFCEENMDTCITHGGFPRPVKIVSPRGRLPERRYWRALGGPHNSLTWMLDPEGGSPEVAIARMRKIIVGLVVERFEDWREIAAFFFPWLHEPRGSDGPLAVWSPHAKPTRAGGKLRGKVPASLRDEIARWNAKDMAVYAAGVVQFEDQLQFVRAHRAAVSGAVPVVDSWTSGQELWSAIEAETARVRPKHWKWTEIRSAYQLGRVTNVTKLQELFAT